MGTFLQKLTRTMYKIKIYARKLLKKFWEAVKREEEETTDL